MSTQQCLYLLFLLITNIDNKMFFNMVRYTVGKITNIQRWEVGATNFGPRASFWMNFLKGDSQLTPPHQSEDFKWKDYCPLVLRFMVFKVLFRHWHSSSIKVCVVLPYPIWLPCMTFLMLVAGIWELLKINALTIWCLFVEKML